MLKELKEEIEKVKNILYAQNGNINKENYLSNACKVALIITP
jgi:hypothetical protein